MIHRLKVTSLKVLLFERARRPTPRSDPKHWAGGRDTI
jgi:hypothetical protein